MDETRTTYKVTTPVDTSPILEAIDALDELLEEAATDQNVQQLADAVNGFTAQLQQQLTQAPARLPSKLTDNGPGSVATKEASGQFLDWMIPNRTRQKDASPAFWTNFFEGGNRKP